MHPVCWQGGYHEQLSRVCVCKFMHRCAHGCVNSPLMAPLFHSSNPLPLISSGTAGIPQPCKEHVQTQARDPALGPMTASCQAVLLSALPRGTPNAAVSTVGNSKHQLCQQHTSVT